MKKTLLFACIAIFTTQAQINLGKLKNQAQDAVDNHLNNDNEEGGLSIETIAKGLKEALEKGADTAVSVCSKADGFNASQLIRIPFPEDAQKVKEAALKVGMDAQVQKFETQLNRAAEMASKEALSLLSKAITSMTIEDAKGILNGSDSAATMYLQQKTTDSLKVKFRPIIQKAIEAVELTKYYEPLATTYNKVNIFRKEDIDPDLENYVLDKSLKGLFKMISIEEGKIRKDPAARITEILQEVFGSIKG